MDGTCSDGRLNRPASYRRGRAKLLVLASILLMAGTTTSPAASRDTSIKERNIGVSRERSNKLPRSEGDQAMVDGWPLYRSERGQTAFNDAMATLKASDSGPPAAQAFAGCSNLDCNLSLPVIGSDGWIPAGRIWVSPTDYVLFVHSPRLRGGQYYRRRMPMSMRYFVFHEFHNSSRNTDPYDTISSHSGSVFVPLYMSKQSTDAQGRRFVVVIQVAPHDVFSVHASNMGSSGPGIEVAKNVSDGLEALQGLAGILVASMIKQATPHLHVVNHRGAEGRPMLSAYERRLATVRSRPGTPTVALPFSPAVPARIASVVSHLNDLILARDASPRLNVAERSFVSPKIAPAPAPVAAAPPLPSPLAQYLSANLTAMKQHPRFAKLIPANTTGVVEESPDESVVYLYDVDRRVLGRIEPHVENDAVVAGQYVYLAFDRVNDQVTPYTLNFAQPIRSQIALTAAAPTLVGPIRLATRPMPKPTTTSN